MASPEYIVLTEQLKTLSNELVDQVMSNEDIKVQWSGKCESFNAASFAEIRKTGRLHNHTLYHRRYSNGQKYRMTAQKLVSLDKK